MTVYMQVTGYVEGGPRVVPAKEFLPYLVLQLPTEVREMLALGPESEDQEPFGCRVCTALDELVINHHRPAEMIFDYHDEDGTEGEACYRRCCDIYEAAGWSREA